MNTRIETDTMGEVAVPTEAYWGAQTQRSRDNFKIGGETLPAPLIRAMALVKKAAAQTNATLGRLDEAGKNLIVQAADEKGVYVVGFCYPVVPKGRDRIRTQISAGHTKEDLDFAVRCFGEVKKEMGL